MGLSNKKEEQLRNMPIIQSRIKTSKNGKYVIQQTVVTNVKPIEYYKAILANSSRASDEPLDEEELLIQEELDLVRRK